MSVILALMSGTALAVGLSALCATLALGAVPRRTR